jgi:ppGpp synthetase/RelA/SpoT-type nucleotidyltranferase
MAKTLASNSRSSSNDEEVFDREYQKTVPTLVALQQEVEFILHGTLKAAGIKVHGIEGRVKDRRSILIKLQEKDLGQAWLQLSDLVGLRVICLLRSELELVDQVLKKHFEIISVDNKIETAENTFGYMSVHYICKLTDEYTGYRYDTIKHMQFEVQVRTLCMHAWAAASHYLDYKGEWDVPSELKRSMNALSAIFYVADNEFEAVYKAKAAAQGQARENSPDAGTDEINLETMFELLQRKFPDRTRSEKSLVSEFVREVKKAGYSSLNQIDVDISLGEALMKEYEGTSDRKFTNLGAARISLGISSDTYRSKKYAKHSVLHDYAARLSASSKADESSTKT